ncbi:MAG TPA: hypothetical protein VFF73_09355 [Planctomycetota bacterium]|nr:hypothetical protein [Planctomycetota bacterium]
MLDNDLRRLERRAAAARSPADEAAAKLRSDVLTRDCPRSLRDMAESSRRPPAVLGGFFWGSLND